MDDVRRLLGAHPDPPKRGPVTVVLRRLLRESVWFLVAVMNLGRRFGTVLLRTEYRLAGQCKRRGACCHHILLEWSPMFDRYPWMSRLILWKYTRLYSFYDRGYSWEVEDGIVARVLGCHALLEDGRCGEYRTRPLICRAFPELPLTGKPMLLKGCGYAFERRDGRPEPRDTSGQPLVQIGRKTRIAPQD